MDIYSLLFALTPSYMVELYEFLWYELIQAKKFLAIFFKVLPLNILPILFPWTPIECMLDVLIQSTLSLNHSFIISISLRLHASFWVITSEFSSNFKYFCKKNLGLTFCLIYALRLYSNNNIFLFL